MRVESLQLYVRFFRFNLPNLSVPSMRVESLQLFRNAIAKHFHHVLSVPSMRVESLQRLRW